MSRPNASNPAPSELKKTACGDVRVIKEIMVILFENPLR